MSSGKAVAAHLAQATPSKAAFARATGCCCCCYFCCCCCNSAHKTPTNNHLNNNHLRERRRSRRPTTTAADSATLRRCCLRLALHDRSCCESAPSIWDTHKQTNAPDQLLRFSRHTYRPTGNSTLGYWHNMRANVTSFRECVSHTPTHSSSFSVSPSPSLCRRRRRRRRLRSSGWLLFAGWRRKTRILASPPQSLAPGINTLFGLLKHIILLDPIKHQPRGQVDYLMKCK